MSDNLKRIVNLAEQLVKAQAKTRKLKEQLEHAQKLQSQLESVDLPELMLELGMSSVTLAGGQTVTISEELTCGITADNHAAALEWLDQHQFGGLIKTQLTAAFGRDDRKKVDYLLRNFTAAAKEAGVEPDTTLKETVHNATLKSFVKEELAKGAPIPMDLFSVHQFKKAVVQTKKAKK